MQDLISFISRHSQIHLDEGHQEIINTIQESIVSSSASKTIIITDEEVGKSTIVEYALIWSVLNYHRKYPLLFVKNVNHAFEQANRIHQHLIRLRQNVQKNRHSVLFEDGLIDVYSVAESVVGIRNRGTDGKIIRPDIVVFDDPQTIESAESSHLTRTCVEFIQKFSYRLPAICIGSSQNRDDALSQISRSSDWDTRTFGVDF